MVGAAIFDLDGTLVDNMAFHARAWVEMSASLGSPTPAERFTHELAGMTNAELFPLIAQRPLGLEELERLSAEKEARYRALYAPHLRLLEGAGPLLRRLKDAGVPAGIATAGPLENRRFVLDGLQLGPLIGAVAGPETGVRGKPFPDLFVAAAKMLGVEPARCVAFEDAIKGVQAGVAAGMKVVGLTTSVPAQPLRDAGATWVLPHLRQLPPDLDAALFGATSGAGPRAKQS